MWLPRLVSATLVSAVVIGSSIMACGGDDGKSSNNPDAKVYLDAKVYMDVGSGGNPGIVLGQPCTPPASGSGQGDCPDGFVCLNLQNASHPWCSKPCSQGAGDTCAQGYTGPGVASCIESITFGSGQAPMDYCGITCAGDGVNGCTAQKCNGTCPGQMTCTGTLQNGSGQAVGSACI